MFSAAMESGSVTLTNFEHLVTDPLATSSVAIDGRVYVCDTESHRIRVLDEDHLPLFDFGTHGSEPGQFDEPADIAVVALSAEHSFLAGAGPALAVADRGNHRVQLFTFGGHLLANIDPWQARGRHSDSSDGAGLPFFRVNPLPQLLLPSKLRWEAPSLEVTAADGRVVSFDLDLALLPDFRTWLESTSRDAARDALNFFMRQHGSGRLPLARLRELAARVHGGLTVVAHA